jgi:hypothetical protein
LPILPRWRDDATSHPKITLLSSGTNLCHGTIRYSLDAAASRSVHARTGNNTGRMQWLEIDMARRALWLGAGMIGIVSVGACTTNSALFRGNIPPGPPDFQAGWADGCDSGTRDAGNPWYTAKRDWDAYMTDDAYKQGWEEGHQTCFENYKSLQ